MQIQTRKSKGITHRVVLLDIDGTVVDSNDQHAKSWVETFVHFGYPEVKFANMRRLIGMGGDKIITAITGLTDDGNKAHAISRYRRKLYLTKYLKEVKAFPRSRDLLRKLVKLGYKIMSVSAAEKQELHATLEATHLSECIDTGAKAERSKPDPDIIFAACKRCHCTTNDTIMIGDTPYDLIAAQAAEVPMIALRCGGWSASDLAGAVRVYDDPNDLFHHLYSSPLIATPPSNQAVIKNNPTHLY